MSELLCINSDYEPWQLQGFLKNKIRYPKEGDIVELLRVVKYPRVNKTGLIVAPYDNQWIEITQGTEVDKVGVSGKMEVSFDRKRFTHLNGKPITSEELKKFNKSQKEENFVKIELKPKENEDRVL